MKDWKKFNVTYFISHMIALVIGTLICFLIPAKKPSKKYPIEVKCHWSTDIYQSYPTMDADSVRKDTIWKDGLYIVNKNIIDIQFKKD
jgi:hypothetical protein